MDIYIYIYDVIKQYYYIGILRIDIHVFLSSSILLYRSNVLSSIDIYNDTIYVAFCIWAAGEAAEDSKGLRSSFFSMPRTFTRFGWRTPKDLIDSRPQCPWAP